MTAIESTDPNDAGEQIEGLKENKVIANQLTDIAKRLAEQHASKVRVSAYNAAAETIASLPSPVRDVFDRAGSAGLVRLPTIGRSIASVIEASLRTGRMPLLDRLRGKSNAEHFFAEVPGVGPRLSRRIHEQLQIETLAELQAAANDGRLDHVQGLGEKRIEAIGACLESRLFKELSEKQPASEECPPVSVNELLDVDREYRKRADSGELAKVRPWQQSLDHKTWLPVMHTERDGRHYTGIYSTMPHAGQQRAIHDWVTVIRDDANAHGRWSIFTAQYGEFEGFRIILGREQECEEFYRRQSSYHPHDICHSLYPELPQKWEEEAGRHDVHG